jgi:hypothetical protein
MLALGGAAFALAAALMAVGMGMTGLVEVIVVVGMDMVVLVGMVMGVAVGHAVVGVLMGVGMGMLVAVANVIVMNVHSVSPYAFFFYYNGCNAGCQIGICRADARNAKCKMQNAKYREVIFSAQ